MDHRREWMDKAAAAGFAPFELIDPVPDESWMSGYGCGGGSHDSMHIGITYLVGGTELTVATASGVSDEVEGLHSRQTVLDAVGSMLEEPLVFPLVLTVRFEDRAIEVIVDGRAVTFKGIVVEGVDGWTLGAHVEPDTQVTIHGSGDLVPVEIRRRNLVAIKGLLAAE